MATTKATTFTRTIFNFQFVDIYLFFCSSFRGLPNRNQIKSKNVWTDVEKKTSKFEIHFSFLFIYSGDINTTTIATN